MKKLVSILTAVTMICGTAASMASFSAFALDAPFGTSVADAPENFHMTWNIRTSENRENTVYIDSSKLADGDYTFDAGIYLNSEDVLPEYIAYATAKWDGYDANGYATRFVHFDNLSNMKDSGKNLSDDYKIEGLNPDGSIEGFDSVTVKYIPSCFSYIANLRGEPTVTTDWTSTNFKYAYSTYGTTVYSAGPYKIAFKDKAGVMQTYDVEWDEKTGTATTVEKFESAANSDVLTNLVIEDYNPNIPEGEAILYNNRKFTAYNLSKNAETTWFGGKSDTAALVSFDVVIDKDTPEGVYYVGFDNYKDTIPYDVNTIGVKLGADSAAAKHIYADNLMPYIPFENNTDEYIANRENDKNNWLKIVVGSGNEESEGQAYDVNGDGKIDVSDATEELRLYAEAAVNADAQIYKSADSGTHSIANATAMLKYYAESAAGLR